MKWRKLVEDDGTLAVEEGETYLFAIKTNQGWDYFVDSLVWDSETPPEWHDAQHGWDGRESVMWFTPIECPAAWVRDERERMVHSARPEPEHRDNSNSDSKNNDGPA